MLVVVIVLFVGVGDSRCVIRGSSSDDAVDISAATH